MTSIINELTKIVSEAFEKCGYDKSLGTVSVSDRLDLCQFQCNGAFAGAKQYRKAPFMIADEVVEKISGNEIFKSVEMVKPGFINMTLNDEIIIKKTREIASDINLGIPQAEKSETIVLDYGGPNVAKPLHIGHLRSAIIGESLKRIARAMGNKVISDVHLGDWGLQIGLVIAELSERNPDWVCFSPDFDPEKDNVNPIDVDELNEIYPYASQKSKSDEAFKEKARTITAELQSGHKGYIAIWKEIMRVSVKDLKENYEKLYVDFDLWYGESDANKYVDELIDVLNKKGLMYKSEGALVVDVEEETDKAPVPPVIIKKSDNSNIYATTDLATIIQREKDFSPDRIWYVVDKRQGLHLTQVFRCAKKAGIVPESTELAHLAIGTMNGKDGKPYKTRDGGVMRLSDLINTVVQAAIEKMSDENFESDEEKREAAQKVAIAAVKFGDLSNHIQKDYIFDIDKFLSFEGKTGTYLIYTVTRINSILRNLGADDDQPLSFNGIYSDIERELLLNIILSGEAFKHALSERAPSVICDNAYKLASLFSTFYHDNHIMGETDKDKQSSWVSLCILVRRLLIKHLDVLGIKAVERM